MRVGGKATVWGGKIVSILGAAEHFESGKSALLLADSKAAISAVKWAGKKGRARFADLKRLLERWKEQESEGNGITLGWVKVHMKIMGNRLADEQAKAGVAAQLQVTEGGWVKTED